MEESTLYNGVTLAKCELLAHLRNNPNFVPRTAAELRAHIAAALDAARVPWEKRGYAPRRDVAASYELGDDDDELVEPVSVPAPQRRQRKRSLAKVCEAARKAGADRVIVDGIVIALSPSAAVPETDANEWDAVLSEVDHGPH
jgi:hypothetical protein